LVLIVLIVLLLEINLVLVILSEKFLILDHFFHVIVREIKLKACILFLKCDPFHIKLLIHGIMGIFSCLLIKIVAEVTVGPVSLIDYLVFIVLVKGNERRI